MFEFWKNISVRQGILTTLIFAVIICLFPAAFADITSGSESCFAGIAAEMLTGGNFILPKLNGTPFLEYPPLYYWLTSLSYSIFGINAFAARLPSVLAAIAIAILVFKFAIRCGFRPWGAVLTAFMLCTGTQFFNNAVTCGPDMLLSFFILWSVYSFLTMTIENRFMKKLTAVVALLLAMTGGAYTKGMIGLLLPAAVIFVWQVWLDVLNKKFSFVRYIILAAVTAAAFEAVGIWYYLILQQEGPEMLYVALVLNNFGSAAGAQGANASPAGYYFGKLPVFFMPWLPAAVAGIFVILRDVRKRQYNNAGILALAFAIIPFTILSAIAAKSMICLLPIIPPCAILAATALLRIPEKWQSSLQQTVQNQASTPRSLHMAAAVMIAAFTTLAVMSGVHNAWIAVLGGITVIAALFCSKAAVRYPAILMAVAMLYPAGMAVYGHQHCDPRLSLRPLFERCSALEKEGYNLAVTSTSEPTRGAAYYYLRHHIALYLTPEETAKAKKTVLIMRSGEKPATAEVFNDNHFLIIKD